MRVSTFIILLIFACCGCGLLLFTGLSQVHANELQAKESVSQRKLALRDLSILETSFNQWLVLSDLILGNDQTYLQTGALDLATKLSSLKQNLGSELKFLPQGEEYLRDFDSFLTRQSDRLNEAVALKTRNRDRRLYELLMEMDSEAGTPIEALSRLREELELDYQTTSDRLDQAMSEGKSKKNYMLCLFLLAIALLWSLSSRKLGRPIARLTSESKLALQEGREISDLADGPIELTELRTSFVELVDSLNEKIVQIEQKQIERERLHQEMMEMSRKAGMAEVASEVLHNVGNVLNSLNVSVALTRKQLVTSAVKKLVIARDALKKNEDDLAGFLTTSKRGRHFPGALDVVTNQLVNENRKYLEESELLLENINHVRSIINTQQTFARSGGVVQSFCLAEAIQSAVRILAESLGKHRIEVDVECPQTLNLTTDKDKLKQVLVNLIANARDAIMENSQGGTIFISVIEIDGSIQLSVRDTGAGILKEDMKNLFAHGFTTKETGHGFGLHSCALAAQVMGGSLSAKSEGRGLGATFVLTIPKEQAELCKV